MVKMLESGTLFSSCCISDSFRGSFSFAHRFDASVLIAQISGILLAAVLWRIDDAVHCIPDVHRFF